MRRLLYAVVVCALGMLFAHGGAVGQNEEGGKAPKGGPGVAHNCRLSVTADKESYKFGSPVNLTLKFENLGSRSVSVANITRADTYEFDLSLPKSVAMSDGDMPERSPLTLRGRAMVHAMKNHGSNQVATLDSGKSVVVQIPTLNRVYDMTLTGEYTLVVRRELPSPEEKSESREVVSAPVSIRITDR